MVIKVFSFFRFNKASLISSTSLFWFHFKHYFPGATGIDNPDFSIQRASNLGGSINLELGRWMKTGLRSEIFMKFEKDQIEAQESSQGRTDVTFGAALSLQF